MGSKGWLGLVVLIVVACGPGGRTASETIQAFLEAVQSEDIETLFCLSAGAQEALELGRDDTERRANFELWARARYDRYLEGRNEGWVDLDGEGIPLVKLFGLGRGAFYTYDSRRSVDSDSLVVTTTIRFGYSRVDLSRLSPGTTFYLGGVPAGKVHAVRIPSGSREIRLEVLETVTVDWGLIRAEPAGGCDGGWRVVSATPVAGSAATTDVTWVF